MGMKEPLPEFQPPKELAICHGFYGRILHRLHYVQTKCRYHEVVRGENNAGSEFVGTPGVATRRPGRGGVVDLTSNGNDTHMYLHGSDWQG